MSKWQRQMYKRDDRYIKLTKNLSKDNAEHFEAHFKEYEEIVDASIHIYTSEGFRGTIFSTGAIGVANQDQGGPPQLDAGKSAEAQTAQEIARRKAEINR
jgi:hypothetical protein